MNVERRGSGWTAVATLLAPISWGTTYVTVTEFLPDARPLLVALVRVVPAGLVLLLLGTLSSWWRPRGPAWWQIGLLASFNFGVFFPLLTIAVYRLPGGVAAAVGGLQPILVGLLSWLLARRQPRLVELAIGVVAALGVGLVVIRPGAGFDAVGVFAAVAANISFAAGVVLTKRFPVPENRLSSAGWQLLLGGVLILPLAATVEGMPGAVTTTNLAGFAYLSLIGTALAFVLWFRGIRRLPSAAPPLLGLAAPVTGAALGWVILDQALTPLQLVGFVITLPAIAYGALLGRDTGSSHFGADPHHYFVEGLAGQVGNDAIVGREADREETEGPFVLGASQDLRQEGHGARGVGESGETHVMERGDEKPGRDPDALLDVVVVAERPIGEIAVSLLEEHN